jgi:nucleoside-diphosphate-sugar epimerase
MPYFEPPRALMNETTPAGVSEKPLVQPVMATDVADAFIRGLDREETVGEIYPIGGPRQYEWPEMLEAIRETIPGKTRPVWGVPAEVGEATARAARAVRVDHLLPFCLSDVQMASENNACSIAKMRGELGLEPAPVSFDA